MIELPEFITDVRRVIGTTYVNGDKYFVLDYFEIEKDGTMEVIVGMLGYEITPATPINQDILPDAEAIYQIPVFATGIPVLFEKTVPPNIKVLKEFEWENNVEDYIPDDVIDELNNIHDDTVNSVG